MLLVRAEARPSPTHGLGLFACEPIAAGAPIWRQTDRSCLFFTDDEVEALPAAFRAVVEKYAYHWQGRWVLGADDARFTNHSDDPNTRNGDDGLTTVAARDIAAGEEITADYHDFDRRADDKLGG